MEVWEIIRAIDELDDWRDVHEIYEHCYQELNDANQFEVIRKLKCKYGKNQKK